MGRWKQAKQCIIDVGLVGRGANLKTTTLIVDAHNADCDAYEARIAELERQREFDIRAQSTYHDEINRDLDAARAELARVKAESLRVVPDGEACEINKIAICGCFLFNGATFRLYSFSREEFGAWQLSDHTEHLFAPDTIVQPVRLVLLEDVG